MAGVNLDAARQRVRSALAGEPNSSSYLDTLAVIEDRAGRAEAARAAAERAARLDPGDLYLRWQLARLSGALPLGAPVAAAGR